MSVMGEAASCAGKHKAPKSILSCLTSCVAQASWPRRDSLVVMAERRSHARDINPPQGLADCRKLQLEGLVSWVSFLASEGLELA